LYLPLVLYNTNSNQSKTQHDIFNQGLKSIPFKTNLAVNKTRIENNGNDSKIQLMNEFSAVTDAQGNYSIQNIPPGKYELLASRTGLIFNPSSRQITIPPNATDQGFTANHLPDTPSNPTPNNEAINQSLNVDLSWDGGDPDGDAVTYDVYFDTSNPPAALVSDDQSETTYAPGTLEEQTQYFWKIVAKDEHNETTDGPVWNFTTVPKRVELSITKKDHGVTVEPGEVLTYTITYSNTGSLGATGVIISDTLPIYTVIDLEHSSADWQQMGDTNVYTYFVNTLDSEQQ
jgi:uncharacterized repeat protein (TIGR01451 family)